MCGYGIEALHYLAKVEIRVRFPLPAQNCGAILPRIAHRKERPKICWPRQSNILVTYIYCYYFYMQYKKFGDDYVVSLARGEEIVSSLKEFCAKESVSLGSITGIGAGEDIELGYYDVGTKEYRTKVFKEEHEITALAGNITQMNNELYLHLHITIGNKHFEALAGHLSRATVSGACEIFIHAMTGSVSRYKDEEVTGLNLLDIK